MPSDIEISRLFDPLYQRFSEYERAQQQLPLLAHYTSVAVLEKILSHDEVWFANPLFMNDLEEMRFGMNEGFGLLMEPSRLLSAGGTKERADALEHSFAHYWRQFNEEEAFDTYVFCLSEHNSGDYDGLLSMWRGYGGHGKGAAIVFDAAKITRIDGSPLMIAKVDYATGEERLRELGDMLDEWTKIVVEANIDTSQLAVAAHRAFSLIKLFALLKKHSGFDEEQEWRVIYMPDYDTDNLLKSSLGYHMGPNGVEPKLKYKYGTVSGVSVEDAKLDDIIDRIILGPAISSTLAVMSVKRMLRTIGKDSLIPKVVGSTIPLRAP